MNIGLIDTTIDENIYGLKNKIRQSFTVDLEGLPAADYGGPNTDHGTFNAFLLCGQRQTEKDSILAPETDLYVCNLEGKNVALNMVKALDWMLNQPIKILVMPFGEHHGSPFLVPLMNKLLAKGVLPIAAIGNKGAGKFSSPGWYESVLSVGAVDAEGNVPAFSGSKNLPEGTCLKPDILAPGVNLNDHLEALKKQSGTSSAAVYLAGCAAILWKEFPDVSPNEIYHTLVNTSKPLDEKVKHRCKHGVLDIKKARLMLEKGEKYGNKEGLEFHEIKLFRDENLMWHVKHASQDKTFEAIVILRDGLHMESRYPDISINQTFCEGEIYFLEVNKNELMTLKNDMGVLVIQNISIPVFSLV